VSVCVGVCLSVCVCLCLCVCVVCVCACVRVCVVSLVFCVRRWCMFIVVDVFACRFNCKLMGHSHVAATEHCVWLLDYPGTIGVAAEESQDVRGIELHEWGGRCAATV
jgi:hypothetical protein